MATNEIATVAQRMNNAGPTKGTGITKSSIKQNLFNKSNQQGQARSQQKANPIPYRVPGQIPKPAGTNKPLGSPQQGQAPSPLVNNDDPYFYNPIAKPDYSTIDPNDPAEIEYQRKEKERNDIWKRGGVANAAAYSTSERTRIGKEYQAAEAERVKKFVEARKADPEGFENWFYTVKSPGTLRPAGSTMRLPDPTNFVKPTRMPHLQEGWETPDPNQGSDSLRNLAAKANSYYANGQLGTDEANEAITKYATAVTADHTKRQNDPPPNTRPKFLSQQELEDKHRKEGGKFAPAYPGGPMIPVFDSNIPSESEKAINDKHAAGGGKFATTPGGKKIPISGTANNERSQSLIDAENAHRAKGGKFAPDSQGRMIPVMTNDGSVPVGPYVESPLDKRVDLNAPKTYAKTPMSAPVSSYNYV